MNKKKFLKPMIASLLVLFLVGGAITWRLATARAEQSGSSPESGVTSYIKTLYTDLTTLTYGSDTDTPDWGAYWNRIKTAAKWTPSGNAATSDVRTGKTFYSTTRGQQTGTAALVGSCPNQVFYDSYGAPVTQTTNCNTTWIANPTPLTGDDAIGFDPRTGLTWSQALLNNSGTVVFSASTNSIWNWNGINTFTVTTANATAGATYTNNGQTFTVVSTIVNGTTLTVTSTGSPAASGTLTRASGSGDATITFSAFAAAGANNVAVGGKTAKLLCSDRGNGWRLPSQKELMQAYIDGSFWNLTQPSYGFWSATEGTAGSSADYVNLGNGTTGYSSETTATYQVRCVR